MKEILIGGMIAVSIGLGIRTYNANHYQPSPKLAEGTVMKKNASDETWHIHNHYFKNGGVYYEVVKRDSSNTVVIGEHEMSKYFTVGKR